jgi:hypothetical protein
VTITPAEREANRRSCESFLERLFAPYTEGYLDCRAIAPAWQSDGTESWNATRYLRFHPLRYAAWVASQQFADTCLESDSFYGVLPRSCESGKMTAVSQAAWLWADIDMKEGGPAAARNLLGSSIADSSLPKPTLAVETRSGLHLYWPIELTQFSTPHDRLVFTSVLKGLAKWIGSSSGGGADLAVTNVNAVLRPPGTYNLKDRDNPVLVSEVTVGAPAPRRSLSWWKNNIPGWVCPEEYQPREPVITSTKFRMTKVAEQLLADPPPGERHATLRKILSGAVYYGQQIGELESIAREFADKTGLPHNEAIRLARHFARL